MHAVGYGHTRTFRGITFDQAVARTTDALKSGGFGVLTDIDVKATMKKKLDVDFRNYRILGACNPGFAHKALTSDPAIGLLLPCNAIVLEEDDGSITVSIAKPESMFEIAGSETLEPLAAEVGGIIQKVVGTLEELGAEPS